MYNILTIGCDFNFDVFNIPNCNNLVNINKENNVPETVNSFKP